MPRLSVQDLTDNWLAEVLRLLSNDEYWRAEADGTGGAGLRLVGHLRAYRYDHGQELC